MGKSAKKPITDREFVLVEADGALATLALESDGERITALYLVRNPDKLGHIAGTTVNVDAAMVQERVGELLRQALVRSIALGDH